jgi:hypothetical protein
MIAVKIAAILVTMACVLGLEYSGSRYTIENQQGTHEFALGFVDLCLKDRQKINLPVLIGVGAITICGTCLFFRNKKN